ncbi:hypothetical protein [Cohaesibacter haloalkalitolerans]|uniref:hypothetical protein n=1 Tax=Cohaesibacter haloalkalitolerans TaxID=1162980 RepID=UPI000E6485B1|nr:hypothetical protein [Cohaesibacter haloalkalitolerans]
MALDLFTYPNCIRIMLHQSDLAWPLIEESGHVKWGLTKKKAARNAIKKSLAVFLIFGPVVQNAVAMEITGSYAIQNVETGLDLRPFEARKEGGNPVILYDHHFWRCVTRTFVAIEDGV